MRFGAVSRSAKGNITNGDAIVLREWNDQTLMAVIDGLGHGSEAFKAAQKAAKYVEDHAAEALEELVKGCHNHIRCTRGVTIGMVRINRKTNRFSYCGIGNIGIRIVSNQSPHPISRPGIVGFNVHKVTEFEYPYEEGSVILLYSDGVSSKFDPSKYPNLRRTPQRVAQQIIEEWGKEIDDATLIIATEAQ